MFELLAKLKVSSTVRSVINIVTNPFVSKAGTIAVKAGQAVIAEDASQPVNPNVSWVQQLASVFTMPITQKAIAICLTLTPLVSGVGLISAAELVINFGVVAIMHYNETKQLMYKKSVETEVKYISDYQKSELALSKHKDLAQMLGVSFANIKTKESDNKKVSKRSNTKAAVLSTLDMLKPIGTSLASFNSTFILLTTIEILIEGKNRFTKIFKDKKNRNEVEETLRIAKKLMPEFTTPYELVLKAMERKIEAIALEKFLKRHPDLTTENFTKNYKQEFEKLKIRVRQELYKEKDGIYSKKTIFELKKTTESFVTAAIKAVKIGNDNITEYQSLKGSKEFEKVKQTTEKVKFNHKNQKVQQKAKTEGAENKTTQKAQQKAKTEQAENKTTQKAQPAEKTPIQVRKPAVIEHPSTTVISSNHASRKSRSL